MKKGIIIILYSIGLLAVLSLILISTYEPKNFTVEIGKTQQEIVKLTELSQNYQNFIQDSAINSAYNSRFYEGDEFEINFVLDFEKRVNEYPKFYKDFTIFEYSLYMDYIFEFEEDNRVKIIGLPDQILDTQFYLDSDDVIYSDGDIYIRDYILINSSIMEFKFYPYFEIYSDYGLNNPQNDEENN